MADTFLSDTEAPSLGLYLTKTANGMAYEVRRTADDKYLLHGDRVQVRSFLRGYAAALDHPAIRHITNMVNDEDSTTTDILEAAIDVANIAPGGRS